MSFDVIADAIKDAAAHRAPACGASTVIAIDGPSGAGKTDLASRWTPDSHTAVLHLDDLYPGWHGLEATPPVVASLLGAIAAGGTASASTWDWEHGQAGQQLHLPPRPTIVVEGVGAAASVIRPFLSLIVWVDAPTGVRHARAVERDGNAYAPWWDIWAEQERQHFTRELTRTHADITVTT